MSSSERPADSNAAPTPPGSLVRLPGGSPLRLLRVGLGLLWGLNLLYIVVPANQFFPSFSAAASSFRGTSIGGPQFPELVAAYPLAFSILIAVLTAYLTVAFLTGSTLRIACVLGILFNGVLLATQFGSLVAYPGGTDVGPQPLYLLIYLVLLVSPGPARWTASRPHGTVVPTQGRGEFPGWRGRFGAGIARASPPDLEPLPRRW